MKTSIAIALLASLAMFYLSVSGNVKQRKKTVIIKQFLGFCGILLHLLDIFTSRVYRNKATVD